MKITNKGEAERKRKRRKKKRVCKNTTLRAEYHLIITGYNAMVNII